MPTIHLLDATQVDLALLDAFLRRVYPPLKSEFLRKHGDWLHRSPSNRIIAQVDGQIAGYCAVIPTQVWAVGRVQSALWWVDLIVAPEFRGLGMQTLIDERVRGMSDLLLGFPNKLAGIIHRKHGWGVREDARALLLPLHPSQVKMARNAEGTRGLVLRLGAWGLAPLAALWRTRLRAKRPRGVWKMESFDAKILSGVFLRARRDGLNTTWRDAAYFDWRYAQSPHCKDYRYFLAGARENPTHYLILRHLTQPDGLRYTRILDLFGDLNDTVAIHHLLALAVQDALAHGSGQVTLASSLSALLRVAKRLGFIFSAPFGFCWRSASAEWMSAFAGENYWTLSDSDNDAPD
ncbi:MAG: GNAT family N-acetyltransferase [Chloroflexota bacterium]